jgi:predicted RNase H-like HicB family nuclease
MQRRFTLEYWVDDGWYVGRLKEVPGVFSQAETLKDLEANIRDAYKLMISTEISPKLSFKHEEKELDINL